MLPIKSCGLNHKVLLGSVLTQILGFGNPDIESSKSVSRHFTISGLEAGCGSQCVAEIHEY